MLKLSTILDDWKARHPVEYAAAIKNAGGPMAALLERIADHDSVPAFIKGEVRGWAKELRTRAELERPAAE